MCVCVCAYFVQLLLPQKVLLIRTPALRGSLSALKVATTLSHTRLVSHGEVREPNKPRPHKFGLNWAKFDRVSVYLLPNSANKRPRSAKFGRSLPNCGHIRPNTARVWTSLAQRGPDLAQIGQCWATLGRSSTPGNCATTAGQIFRNFCSTVAVAGIAGVTFGAAWRANARHLVE